MRFRRALFICTIPALLSLTGFIPAFAADAATPAVPGTRVRVFATPRAHPLTGTLDGVDATSLRLAGVKDQGQVEILRASVTRFEMSRGKQDYPVQGLVFGMIAGALAGTAVGLIAEDLQGSSQDCFDCLPGGGGLSPAYYTIGFGALGGVLGLLVGASIDRDKWARTDIPGPVGDAR